MQIIGSRFARRVMPALALACVAGVSAEAQKPPSVVKARLVLATQGAHSSSVAKAAVVAQIRAGYHINALHPSLDYLIPTEVQLNRSAGVTVEKVIYPPGRPVRFAFLKTPLAVYEGEVLIGLVLKLGRADASSVIPLRGKLSYQACNDHACFAPTSIPLRLVVPILPASVPLQPAHAAIFSKIRFN